MTTTKIKMSTEKVIEQVFSNRYKLSQKRASEFLALLAETTQSADIINMSEKSKFYFDSRFGQGWNA